MSSVWRVCCRRGGALLRLPVTARSSAPGVAAAAGPAQRRLVSTSKDKKDILEEGVTTGVIQEPHRVAISPEARQKLRAEYKTDQWQTFGFDIADEATDRRKMHQVFFLTVSLGLVLGSFTWAYLPDSRMLDWAQREAYLQIHERESKGLPLLDPNLVDPAQFELPSDDELGDTRIII